VFKSFDALYLYILHSGCHLLGVFHDTKGYYIIGLSLFSNTKYSWYEFPYILFDPRGTLDFMLSGLVKCHIISNIFIVTKLCQRL